MAKAKAKVAGQPIVDVSNPNDTPPAENSKSVFITKRPLMRDPMMVAPAGDAPSDSTSEPATNTAAAEPAPAKLLSVSHQLVITPPSSSEPAPAAEVDTPAAAQPITDVTQPEVAAPDSAAALPEPGSSQSEAPEVKLDPLNQEAAEAQADDEAAKRQAELAALVDSQTYFLPVDGVELQRARYFVALGAVLIIGLAVIWADIALDAGLVTVNGIPHTTFFQQTKVATTDPHNAVPATQTYTAPLSKLSFKLLTGWNLDATKSTAAQDVLTAGPSNPNPTIGSTNVQFASGPTLVTTAVAGLVDNVHYQKLAHTKGAATYLQEVVYHTDQTHYNVSVTIVNANNLKVGDVFNNLTPTFYTTNANAQSQLSAVTTRTSGFASQAAAEKYQQLNAYQQARTVLLSLTSPKQ